MSCHKKTQITVYSIILSSLLTANLESLKEIVLVSDSLYYYALIY